MFSSTQVQSPAVLKKSSGAAKIGLSNGRTIQEQIDSGELTLNRVGRPTAPSAVVVATSGVLNGTHYYMVSMVTADGETEVSTPSAPVLPSGEQVDVTIPVSTDSRVTARKIYRTPVGANDSTSGKLVATINDNTTTTYRDNIADGSLGANAPHFDTTSGQVYDGDVVVGNVGGLSTKYGKESHNADSGYACTAIGAFTLKNNNGGFRNTAVGTDAFVGNVDGYNNTGVGVHAGNDCVSGHDNTHVGLNAGFKNTSNSNTSVGSNAFAENVSGQRNTSIGATAAQLKTGGDDNTTVGSEANYSAGSSSGVTAVGRRAGYNITSGNFNSVFGYFASYSLTTGASNVSFGGRSLYSNVSGNGNIGIGWNAGYYETGSNHLWIDNQPRADLADGKTKALIYGEMGVDRSNQKLDVNGQLNPLAGLGMPGRTVSVDGSVEVDDTVLSCNKGTSLTLTLPTGKADKILILRNLQNATVVSASANVQPIGGGADSAAILPATQGAWAIMRCRTSGAAWEIIASG